MTEDPKRKITVPVTFRGSVDVYVPAELPIDIAKELGAKLAIAQVLATVENPDNGECLEYAMDEFVEEHESHLDVNEAEEHWEASRVDSIGGEWRQTDLEPIIAEGFSDE